MNKQHFYDLASHAAGQPILADAEARGYGSIAELQRGLAQLERRDTFGEGDFQDFLRFCRVCSPNSRAEWEWQKTQVVVVWGYPRGVFCVLTDNGHSFVECDDELAALYGL